MRLELQWAFVKEDMQGGPCAICEAEFTPRAVIIRADQRRDDLGEVCEDCFRCLTRRMAEGNVPILWPTWSEYQALVEAHPEPMFATQEEFEASEPMEEHWPAYAESWLWTTARD